MRTFLVTSVGEDATSLQNAIKFANESSFTRILFDQVLANKTIRLRRPLPAILRPIEMDGEQFNIIIDQASEKFVFLIDHAGYASTFSNLAFQGSYNSVFDDEIEQFDTRGIYGRPFVGGAIFVKTGSIVINNVKHKNIL